MSSGNENNTENVADTESNKNEDANTGCWQGFSNVAKRYGIKKPDIWYAMVGDMVWTPFSYLGFSIDWRVTGNASFEGKSQWLGQELYPPLAMIFAAAAHYAYHRYANQNNNNAAPFPKSDIAAPFPKSDIAALIASVTVGIYVWDRAQTLGVNLAQSSLGLSQVNAGYAASVLTGVLPGPAQYMTAQGFKLCVQDKEWKQCHNEPNYCKNFFKGLGLSTTVGAIPGAIWQDLFNAAAAANLGPVWTTILVAGVVASCNWAAINATEQIMEKGCGQATSDCLGWFASCCGEKSEGSSEQQAVVTVEGVFVNSDHVEEAGLYKAPLSQMMDCIGPWCEGFWSKCAFTNEQEEQLTQGDQEESGYGAVQNTIN